MFRPLLQSSRQRVPRNVHSLISSACNFNVIASTRAHSNLADPFAASRSRSDDQKLRGDVKLLGQILGSCIKNENEEVFNSVEKLRSLGRKVGYQHITHTVLTVFRCGLS